MASHKETNVDLDQPYEQNIIGLRGIIYFSVGLFLLIVITFGLMWVFQFQLLQPQYEATDKENENPLAMSKEDRIPKEYQLQGAPGFKVKDPRTGLDINLELREPQAEYRELMKIWEDQWENGEKVIDPETKKETVVSLPIAEAKKKFLESGIKAKGGVEGEKALTEARSMVSSASAGRTRTDNIR